MRIGRATIEPKFFVIVGLLLALAFGALTTLLGGDDDAIDPATEPAFDPTQLVKLKPGWLGKHIEQRGINRLPDPDDPNCVYGEPGVIRSVADMVANPICMTGQPVRLKVYLPQVDSNTRPDLQKSDFSHNFVPATFIPPDRTTTVEELAERATEVLELQEESERNAPDGRVLMVGFRADDTPPPGAAYEINALYYWRSDQVNSRLYPEDGSGPLPAPVLLVDSYTPLPATELAAPTTHRAMLNFIYREDRVNAAGAMELIVHDIEWSAGRQMRVCVSLTNDSTAPQSTVWQGVSSTTAMVANVGDFTGEPNPAAGFFSAATMQPGQTITGYIDFNGVRQPGPLTLAMPGLNSGTEVENQVQVPVSEDKIVPVGENTQRAESPCAVAATRNPGAADQAG